MRKSTQKDTIEAKASDVILQERIKVNIGGVTFLATPPMSSTLIEVSKYISYLPPISEGDNEAILQWVLKNAKDIEVIYDIIEVLIMGAVSPFIRLSPIASISRWFKRRYLRKAILRSSPKELILALVNILQKAEASDFFVAIVFLKGENHLKPTGGNTTSQKS